MVRNRSSRRAVGLGISNLCAGDARSAAACRESAGETGESLRVDPGFERRADEMVEDSVERVGVAETHPDDWRSGEKGERRRVEAASRQGKSSAAPRRSSPDRAQNQRRDRQRRAGRELDDDNETAVRPFLRRAPFDSRRDDQRIVAVGAGEIAERGELGERRRRRIGDDQRARNARDAAVAARVRVFRALAGKAAVDQPGDERQRPARARPATRTTLSSQPSAAARSHRPSASGRAIWGSNSLSRASRPPSVRLRATMRSCSRIA